MSDEAERWKEKYLKSIDQQDKLERRWNARLDLLRRGLVRSSLAAEGADRAVDLCMKEMREIVRKDDMDAGLAALIPRLEKAVLDSEQRREQRVEQMGTALNSLVAQLQALPLPKEVSKPLKRFAKSLEDRVNQARELPLLLGELSTLQAQALELLEHPEDMSRPGFLQRLFGGRESVEPGALEPATPAPAPAPAPAAPAVLAVEPGMAEAPHRPLEPVAVDHPVAGRTEVPEVAPIIAAPAALEATAHTDPDVPPAAVEASDAVVSEATPEPEPVAASLIDESTPPAADIQIVPEAPDDVRAEPVEPAVVALAEQTQATAEPADESQASLAEADPAESDEDGPYALPSSPEPTYSSVATHIEETLLGLLNDLTLPEHHQPQAEAMRARLEHGLNWYELLPILDDLAVLMLAITDGGQQEFEIYLKQLNERLESFQSNLQIVSADHADTQSASRQLDDQLRQHVDGLQSSVLQASDLPSLKNLLEGRLEGLLSTMDQHQKQRDEREQEVASTLQSLVGRVATMEQEAQGFRAHLEEQRQKALIDTLTGLPNRAAWNERLEHEIDRLQKTRSSLLMGILDLDHFKRINDGYGHLAGDKVLKIIATQLRKRLRSSDFVARFGGEEFVFLLPQTSLADGLIVLEKLRNTIEQSPFHFKGEPVVVTASMGITSFRAGERSDLVLKRADEALYRAKDAGRNRIEQG